MARRYWLPKTRLEQYSLVFQFRSKIAGCAAELGLTLAQVALAIEICDGLIEAYEYTDKCRSSMQAVTKWRELVFVGDDTAEAVPSAPVFVAPPVISGSRGLLKQFSDFRNYLVKLPTFTNAIGADLGILGTENQRLNVAELAPALKISPIANYGLRLTGRRWQMEAIRVDYRTAEGNWRPAGFLTRLPGELRIAPTKPGVPEKIFVRAIFIKANQEYGSYSPDYTVTIS